MCRVAPLLSLWAFVANQLQSSSASPTLNYPVSSQVPWVAYAAQPYDFTFAGDTFESNEGPLSYTLASQPSWLQLDQSSRTFSGTPTLDNVGTANFKLIATDADGQTATAVTLIVLEAQQIQPGAAVLPQLAKAGKASAPASLILPPLKDFVLSFTADTFNGTSSATTFYARSADGTPLPSWVQFNANTLTFSGLSPPFVSPSTNAQVYGIQLIATDIAGFTQGSASFDVVVSQHQLAFEPVLQNFKATPGQLLTTPPLIQNLTLDDVPVAEDQLTSKTLAGPDWLSLDQETLSLKGDPPSASTETTVTISVVDIYGDVANATIIFDSASGGRDLLGPLPAVNATIDHDFQYVVPLVAMTLSSPITLQVDLQNASWLAFSSPNRTIHGFVPPDLVPQAIDINITAMSGGSVNYGTLTLNFVKATVPNISKISSLASIITQSSTGSIPTITGTETPNSTRGRPSKRAVITIVLTLVLCVLAVMLGILCLCIYRHRRKPHAATEMTESEGPRQASHELPEATDRTSIRASQLVDEGHVTTPPGPLQVQLLWPPSSLTKHKNRLSRSRTSRTRVFDASDWGGLACPGTLQPGQPIVETSLNNKDHATISQNTTPAKHMAGAFLGPPSQSLASQRSLQSKRASRGLSTISTGKTGLRSRLNGAGHGSGVLEPSPDRENRSSWQTTFATIPDVESVQADALPAPASATTSLLHAEVPEEQPSRPTIRKISGELDDIISSFESQRQIWHTSRARDKLEGVPRFSNAGSSRALSHSKTLSDPRRSPGKFIPGRMLSPYSGRSRHNTQNTWSGWSGVSPAARMESAPFRGASTNSHVRGSSKLGRTVSTVSSRQFESAASSEADWEDEGLVEAGQAEGQRHWRIAGDQSNSQSPSPRLPFEAYSNSRENVVNDPVLVGTRKPRLADDRRRVSVEGQKMHKSKASHRASFRFI